MWHPVHARLVGLLTILTQRKPVVLFKEDEADAWMVLGISFCTLLVFDFILATFIGKNLSLKGAMSAVGVSVLSAFFFGAYIYTRFGPHAASEWTSAYMLEWLLSFDNLFVFHQIFVAFGTPPDQRHKPLMAGICGAVFLRLVALSAAEYLVHSFWIMHFILGGFLVFTGVRTLMEADDDEDYTQGRFIQMVATYLPIVDRYDKDGAFFVRVQVSPKVENYGSVDEYQEKPRKVWRGTLLVLVVIAMEITDLIFAVDSISAIVAQVDDLFLAYSAILFAMLGLRSGYFIVELMAQTFRLFKFGIAAILIFIGFKLICSHWFSIPALVVLLVMPSTLGLSVVLSYVIERKNPRVEGDTGSAPGETERGSAPMLGETSAS
jgi:tellurite resistance protein TerC